jgi:cysteine synthase
LPRHTLPGGGADPAIDDQSGNNHLPYISVETVRAVALQEPAGKSVVDWQLLHAFETEFIEKTPHAGEDGRIVNPTQLVDLTQALRECASSEYGLDLSEKDFHVLGKVEARLLGGSVKSRAAVRIVHEAIRNGQLTKGMTIFEATSGNFGIALGRLASLGLEVIVLVSRRLEEGVLGELERSGVRTVDLDVDICPAPGIQMDPNTLLAKIVATKMRERLTELGLDAAILDAAKEDIEGLLARQDVINLAKLLAKIYGGFCPEQYDNWENPNAHALVTGPEIDQQLGEGGLSLSDHRIVCTFGTGGTSAGLSKYVEERYHKKAVHVVFPPEGTDVAGIRNKSKALGLQFYEPGKLAGQHEADFEQAKKLFAFMVRRGFDIGESSALALYAVLQMVNFGADGGYVVMLADGASKYEGTLEAFQQHNDKEEDEGLEVTAEAVRSNPQRYDGIVWTHTGFAPSSEGTQLIAASLGRPDDPVKVARAADVVEMVTNRTIPPEIKEMVLDGDGSRGGKEKRVLLVCMSGNTSLRVAQVLASNGIRSQSLVGGITRLAQTSNRPLPTLVKPAR